MKKVTLLVACLIFAVNLSGQEQAQNDKGKASSLNKNPNDQEANMMIIQPPPDGGGDTYPWNRDMDRDGYGDPDDQIESETQPYGYVADNTDCDDSYSYTYPGAPEILDGRDNNCDGIIDNGTKPLMPGTISVTKYCDYTKLTRGTPPSGVTFYWQSSSSGTSTSNSNSSINRYGGSVYYLRARDNTSLFWSDARSVSYTIDQPSTWYADTDGDGYGNPSSTTSACSKPSGYVSNNSDCNDSDSGTYPGATEINDGKDNNCDGTIDNGAKPSMPGTISTTKYCDYTKLTRSTPPSGVTFYWQSSSSGTSTSNSSTSINRYSGSVYYLRARNNSTLFWSDARSVSYTIDQPSTWYADGDGDGYGNPSSTTSACSKPSGYVSNNSDCNDSDSGSYPGATEILDGKDNNCDGTIDNGTKPSIPGTISTTKYCDYTKLTRVTPPSGVTWYWQSSSSGISTANSSSSVNRYSGSVYYLRARDNTTLFWSDARSVSYTIDQISTWYADADGDGYGNPSSTQSACSKPSGYVSNNSDCNDNDAGSYPGATEILDGKDNNCDGTIDNGTKPAIPATISVTNYCDYTKLTRSASPSGVTWYWQSSSSGASTVNSSVSVNRTSGSVYYLRARDNSTLFWSDARSVSYTVDQSSVWYADYDEDGLGDPALSTNACSQPVSFVSNNDDIDPYNAANSSVCIDPISGLSNENYVYTKTYQKPVASSGSMSSCDEVVGEVTYFDGLGRPMQQVAIRAGGAAHQNIISTNSWEPGNGSVPFFNQNGATSENNRVFGTDPFGRGELLWVCGNDATSNADGGWNTDYFAVDKNSSYRYSVWVKRLGSQDGTTYHGTQNVNNLNGTANNNPYFWYGDLPNVGEWYLLVGVIHPYTYGGGNSGISGVYDQNGNKVKSGNDFKWRNTTVETRLRSYLYYATNTSTRQYFSRPVFQKLDGNESSIEDLVGRAGKGDIVTHIDYDDYGRKTKDYLPVPMEDDNFGTYRAGDMETSVASYYLEEFSEDFPGMTTATANPFSEKRLEASPLNRVMEQGAPGKSWKVDPVSDTDHTIKFDYLANGSGEVRLYQVDLSAGYSSPGLINSGYYPAGELYKTITKDENWVSGTSHTTEEFKNKQGQVVLKRTYNNGAHDTHYVYDDYGNLTYVLPPGAEATAGKPDATGLAHLCYQYKYDGRNRLIEKKIPGKGWEYIVYNKLDQPIMTQDPNLQAKNQWLFTKYDAFGRVVYTGIIDRAATRGTLQAEADAFSLQFEERSGGVSFEGRTVYYTNRTYPDSYISKIHTENYYDTYLAPAAQAGINVPSSNSLGEDISTRTKTLPTVIKVRVLDTNEWITTVSAYDDKGRVVWNKTVNTYLNTTDIVEHDLDFIGNVLQTETTHQKSGKSDIVTMDKFQYDHVNRLKKHTQEINGGGEEVIAENIYDEIGQLAMKHVGGTLELSNSYSTYRDIVGLTIDSSHKITKNTGVTSWGDSGLATEKVLSGDGFVEAEITASGYNRVMIGLSDNNVDAHYNTIDFAIYTYSDGTVRVYENGSARGVFATYQIGDILKVERIGQNILYKLNDNLLYTSTITSSGNLIGDIAMYDAGTSIKNFKITDKENNSSIYPLQTLQYTYNARGWLKAVNDPSSLGADLFGFKINYNTPEYGAQALYNGNISETVWNSQSENLTTNPVSTHYVYSYDALNRITSALDNTGNYNLSGITYDKMGNILSLQRQGHTDADVTSFGTMDDLTYTYRGNQLMIVDDQAGTDQYGFKDDVAGSTLDNSDDYDYDTNGNLTSDANKGITNITYNHLNLPVDVEFNSSSSQTIHYTYDATGVKLKKEIPGKTTDYAGNFIYEGGTLQFFSTPEGYVSYDNGQFNYVYNYVDHLGNVRLTYSDLDGNGSISASSEILDEKNYYPFGGEHAGYNTAVKGTYHPYGFNGKEEQNELGLEWMDFGARNYDKWLGRWMNVDPLADKYESVSPYNFVLNNPMIHTDPDGRSVDGEFEMIDGEWTKTSTKGDDIGVDFYHTNSTGNEVQKTYVTDRKGNWNVINNGRYALQGESRGSDVDWSTIYNEFLDGNGPERSIFEGNHQSIADIKKNYLFKDAADNFEGSGDSKGGGEVSFWPIWDNVGTGSNMQVQMMGSFNASFYKLGDKTLSLVQDSKSRTSYYYHLPVTNYPRSLTRYQTVKGGVHYNGVSKDVVIPHKQESTTYQTYLFFK